MSLCAGIALALVFPALASAEQRLPQRKPAQAEAQSKAGPERARRSQKRAKVADFGPRSTEQQTTRSAERLKKSYGLVGRTRDGKEIRKELDADAARALFGDRASLEGARKVIGKDNRVAVQDTEEFPYSAVGMLYYEDPADDENWYDCTGTLVGMRTMITKASCLYYYPQGSKSGADGVWNDNFEFWPGLQADGTAPVGSFPYEEAYVFEGWIDEYDGSWASVEPYAIGIVTFPDEVAAYTGALGTWAFADDQPRMSAELVEYPWDKDISMWRSTCKVSANDTAHSFIHQCDAEGAGQPLIVYDDGGHYVVGMNIGVAGNRNLALRLHPAVFDWISAFEEEDDMED